MTLFPPEASDTMSPIVHLVRHGRIPNYLTDQPLTPEGEAESRALGRQLAASIRSGETVSFFSSPARRARQTAALLRDSLHETLLKKNIAATIITPVTVDDRLQNSQFYLGHLSYDPIYPLLDIARWRLHETPSAQNEACANFQAEFWSAPDPVTYWLTHPSDFAESPEAVTERTKACLLDLLAGSESDRGFRRCICVTHSANLRAFLRLVFDPDPGPPPFSSMVTVTEGQVYYQEQIGEFPA
jgi:broad specificity phosphatase PhoE